MIKLFAKKSKVIIASSAVLFATAFQAGACTVNIDQGLLDQLSGLIGNFSFEGQFGGGPQDGSHDGFDDHGGFDNADHNGNDNSGGGGL